MGSNPLIGVVFHWLGGLASASCYLPFGGIKRWSWETYWLVQGICSWIIAPLFFATLLVPNLWPILHAAPSSALFYAFFWGSLWGIGGLTCGLAIRYLGFALGYPIVLGLCTVFGTLMPPIFSGEFGAIVRSTSGKWILLGIGVCVVGIVFSGFAGLAKERELTDAQKKASVKEFQYGKGLVISVISGVMSACFAYGLAAGKPIGDLALTELTSHNRAALWQNLPILVVVLWGGFATNFVWCVVLLIRNRSAMQLVGHPSLPEGTLVPESEPVHRHARLTTPMMMANYALAASAGIMWYFQFFFYSMGETEMGKYSFSSWTLHMASIIIFATIWGFVLKEWVGTSKRTRMLVAVGLFFLVASTMVVGYGNYVKLKEPAPAASVPAAKADGLVAMNHR